mmetsp:Transcript_17493/g.58612  ORF Transcript_17493/g.58612 Transcript_17493/m.58612 type:complete len:212 (-) Transcript_17493:476-1111(-)
MGSPQGASPPAAATASAKERPASSRTSTEQLAARDRRSSSAPRAFAWWAPPWWCLPVPAAMTASTCSARPARRSCASRARSGASRATHLPQSPGAAQRKRWKRPCARCISFMAKSTWPQSEKGPQGGEPLGSLVSLCSMRMWPQTVPRVGRSAPSRGNAPPTGGGRRLSSVRRTASWKAWRRRGQYWPGAMPGGAGSAARSGRVQSLAWLL